MKINKAWVIEKAFKITLMSLFAVSLVCVLHPDVRTSLRGSLLRDYRQVLSTVQGDLQGDGTIFTVAKIRTRDSLALEIYAASQDSQERLVERIELADKRDGYFNFNGEAINLAIDDIDNDGQQAILAPSFDKDLVGHLNIYRYDSRSGHFFSRRSLLQN